MSDEKEIKGILYHIRVKGRLDLRWADWFEGFALTSQENGETLLSGTVADQAALHGVLDKINNLGMTLLLVAQAEYLSTGKCRSLCNQYMKFMETNGKRNKRKKE